MTARRRPLTQALSVFRDEDHEEAEAMDTEAASQSPAVVVSAEAARADGCALAERGSFSEALNCWARALQHHPSDYLLHELCAQAYLELDMEWQAVKSAERAFALAPTWIEGVVTLARCRREVGEVRGSAEMYAVALGLTEGTAAFAEVQEEWAEVRGLVQRMDEALAQDALAAAQRDGPGSEAGSEDAGGAGGGTDGGVASAAAAAAECQRCLQHLRQRCVVDKTQV